MGTVVHVDFGRARAERSISAPKNVSSDIVSLHDYEVRFSRGWLRAGKQKMRLSATEAGDLAECLYWAAATSKKGHPSHSEPIPGVVVTGEGATAWIDGFGKPLSGIDLYDLIADLKSFYLRRRNRTQ